MTQAPYSYPGNMLSYVVVCEGGSIQDPPKDQSGTLKVVDPMRHSSSTDRSQLPFVTMLGPPTGSWQEETGFPPDPGTVLVCSYNMGDPSSRVVWGQPNEINDRRPMEGNDKLSFHLDQAAATVVKKVITQGFTETVQDGAKVRIPKNGKAWYHDMAKGLPTHAALYPMAGTIIPPIQKVETAIQQFSSILGSDVLSQIPGNFMTLQSLLSSLTDSQKKTLAKSMPPELFVAFQSMSNLISSSDGSSSYLCGSRANTEVFLTNAVDLLSNCTSITDLTNTMNRLNYDTSLRGIDTLGTAQVSVNTAFGTLTLDLASDGSLHLDDKTSNTANVTISTLSNIYDVANSNVSIAQASSGKNSNNPNLKVLQAIQAFASMLMNGSLNTGIHNEMNMWKDQAQKIAEMIGRVDPSSSTKFKNILSKGASLNALRQDMTTKLAKYGIHSQEIS